MDCAGPWTIRVKNEITGETTEYKIHILSIVDIATNWPEFVLISTANSKEVAAGLDINWLCRYPKPAECGHDNGNEFMVFEFQDMLISYGIKSKPTTVKNPMARAIVERIHLTLAEYLRTKIFEQDWSEELNLLIQSTAWAIRAANPSNSPYSPCQLAFGREMIF